MMLAGGKKGEENEKPVRLDEFCWLINSAMSQHKCW
jgi:hypothetical protein